MSENSSLLAPRAIDVRRHSGDGQTSHEAPVAIAFLEGKTLLGQYRDRKLKLPALRRLMGITKIETDASLPRGVSCRIVDTVMEVERRKDIGELMKLTAPARQP